MEKRYPSDLTDKEWEIIAQLIPQAKSGGRPREVNIREVANAIFYMVKGGMVWRMLPKDFPCWQTVYNYYREWKNDGIIENIHKILREKVREKEGKEKTPSAAIIDSQSVKIGNQMGEERGFDAAKKVKGRKRHILVDTLGLILICVVHNAAIQDRDGAKKVFEKIKDQFPRLQLIWADGGYAGELVGWVLLQLKLLLSIIKRNNDVKGFQLLPRRWVVERTFSWFNHFRRLSKDYESLPSSSESFIYLAMIRLMLSRLAT